MLDREGRKAEWERTHPSVVNFDNIAFERGMKLHIKRILILADSLIEVLLPPNHNRIFYTPGLPDTAKVVGVFSSRHKDSNMFAWEISIVVFDGSFPEVEYTTRESIPGMGVRGRWISGKE